ncbi:PPE family protein [Mycobacterium kansasii 732]|uniref:PPE family immunomodulator PPE68 n=1 Tax=Mycobacterium pseudokansasii TaxID=2341080 RepID=A0A498QX97_9MYCO|nr:PPE family protein [Mycobacterium pseudokansasii]EUA07677.1 PPE family protein [Mycobacterium kansasii 732]KZS60555.1 hypothetical protein A4G27_08800 [Mycobacterium kansasii]VBA30530.1 PPE family immunomodulator PPE68 [Mycobacterium pseudokansasii]VBA32346.1 PPE family immunomodulator PPE68 [Mycobacterium pseudokansasii]VBA54454.1 PPE family immunomodulator PPE68 [Mycobacterium pseudokansasii]
MLWHALPPELNTARLMAGAGPAPMLAAAMGWESLATFLEAQATELASRLSLLGEAWTGASSSRAIAAAMPMVTWLHTAAAQAQTRAARATAQAAAYTQAMATTPALADIAANHITYAVLTATNFFGINTVPIAAKEFDYFVRMWHQAAVAMDIYQAETIINTNFEKLQPMTAILGAGINQTVTTAAHQLSEIGSQVAGLPVGDMLQQAVPEAVAMMSPMQQLTQPLSELTSLFSQMGSTGGPGSGLADGDGVQMGLLGAGPLSSHPLAGGSGPSIGSGLLHAGSLPGADGTLARTSLVSQLLDKADTPPTVPNAAGSPATGGAAPVAAGGMGRSTPPGAGTRPGRLMPALLAKEDDNDDEEPREDWHDQEDW